MGANERPDTVEQAADLYRVHKDQKYYKGIVDYVMSGPVIPLLVRSKKEDAVDDIRNIVGPTRGEDKDTGANPFPLPNPNPPEESVDRLGETLSLYEYEMEGLPPTPSLRETAVQETFPRDQGSAKILSAFPTLLNDKVKGFIDLFQTKADSYFTKSLARGYGKSIEKYLESKGLKKLPEEKGAAK